MRDIIIITGGANGLGLELTKQSMQKGFFVCNIDRDIEKMNKLNEIYKESYKGFIGDISNEEFVKDTIKEISMIGNIKILVNNAGEPSFKLPIDYKDTDIEISCIINLKVSQKKKLDVLLKKS